jgi:predicted DNA-binding transcriptional regulator AlpA
MHMNTELLGTSVLAPRLTAVASHDPVGLSDIAEMLGVTRTTAARYTKRSDFPEPALISRGRVWSRAQVARWAQKTLPLAEGYQGHRTKAV